MARSILAIEIRSPARSSNLITLRMTLFISEPPKWIVSLSGFLLVNGNERGEEIDDAFEISGATPGACPFVVQRGRRQGQIRR